MSSEAKQKAIDYAKTYPLVEKDTPLMGPVTVGNVSEHNGRTIVNLCLRTKKSDPMNAVISFPNDWVKAKQFKKGDQVNFQIQDGYVKNIWSAKPEVVPSKAKPAVSAARVNEDLKRMEQDIEADKVVKTLVAETEQNQVLETVAPEADDRPF